MTMASSPSSTMPPRTPISKKPVPNTPQQSPLRLKTDNLSNASSGGGYGSAVGRGVGNSYQQKSPELSPVSPLSAGSVASWRREDYIAENKKEEVKEEEGEEDEVEDDEVEEETEEEESFQAQIERELRQRECQRMNEFEEENNRQQQEEIERQRGKERQVEEQSERKESIIGGDRYDDRQDDRQDGLDRRKELEELHSRANREMDEQSAILEEDSDAELIRGSIDARSRNMELIDKGKGKGKNMEKPPSVGELLPREIIQQILCCADPNTFDTLSLISSKWYHASRSAFVYAHQLRQLGIAVPGDPTDDKLPELVDRFNAEARRGLFEAYLKPKITEVQLICSSPSSAGALPGGDAFRFEFSAKGRYLLALSSSRIFVVCLAREEVSVKREFKILKRPVTAAILDDGLALAVLSSNHVVTLYDLSGERAIIMKTLPLENPPRTIALSPGAAVLAAAYEGGIEVYSLHPSALSTDRRAVNCDPVDALAFSSDGLVLLGTTLHTRAPTTVIISAPFFSTDIPEEEGLSQMWTTQVLFPRSSRDNSHATLLPASYYHDDDENTWAFTFDRHFETFRAVRVDDLRNGHTYFAGPSDGKSVGPTVLPSPSVDGEMVAVGFGGKRVWVYGVPGELDLEHKASVGADGQRNSTGSLPSDASGGGAGSGAMTGASNSQQGVWQALSDRSRNMFVRGRQIGEIDGLAGLKFLRCQYGERLVAVASGGVGTFESGEGEDLIVDGGRVILFDFGRCPSFRAKTIISIEIGDGQQGHVETLTEEERDLETEIQMARKRTVTQRTRQSRQQAQNQQHEPPPVPSLPISRSQGGSLAGFTARPVAPTRRPAHLTNRSPTETTAPSTLDPPHPRHEATVLSTFSPGDEDITNFEGAFDIPYSQSEPRPASAFRTRLRNAPVVFGPPRHQQALNNGGRVVGPDGRPIPPPQPPTRQDDQWEEPPPLYTPRSDNDPPLPLHLLLTLQPRGTPLPIMPGGLPHLTGPVTMQHQQQVQQQLQVHQQLMPQIQQYHTQQQQQLQQHQPQVQAYPQQQHQPQYQHQQQHQQQYQQQAQHVQPQPIQQYQQQAQHVQPQQIQQYQQQAQHVQPQQIHHHAQPHHQPQHQHHPHHQAHHTQQPHQPQPFQPQQHLQQQQQQPFQPPQLQPPQRTPQQPNSWGAAQGANMINLMRRGLSTRTASQPVLVQPSSPVQASGSAFQFPPNSSMLNVNTAVMGSVSAPVSPAIGNGEPGVERSYSAPLTPGGYIDLAFHARRPSTVSMNSFSSAQPAPQPQNQWGQLQQQQQQQQQQPIQHPPRLQSLQQHQPQMHMPPVIPANIPLPGTPPMRPLQQRPETPTMVGGERGRGVSPIPSLDLNPYQQHNEYAPPSAVTMANPGSPALSTRSLQSTQGGNPAIPIPPIPGQHQHQHPHPHQQHYQQQQQQYPPHPQPSYHHRPPNIPPAAPAVPSPLRRSTNGNGGTLRLLSRSISRSRGRRGGGGGGGGGVDSPAASGIALPSDDPATMMIRDPFQAHAIASSSRGGVGIPVGIGVRRNPSRPERSAAKHVRDAKKRRLEKEMERMEKNSVAGSVTSRFRGKDGSCVVM